jgi:hypothetical protein
MPSSINFRRWLVRMLASSIPRRSRQLFGRVIYKRSWISTHTNQRDELRRLQRMSPGAGLTAADGEIGLKLDCSVRRIARNLSEGRTH